MRIWLIIAVAQKATWHAANNFAKARGGYLATITSQEENDFVVSLIRPPEYWIFTESQGWWDGPWIGGVQTVNSYPTSLTKIGDG